MVQMLLYMPCVGHAQRRPRTECVGTLRRGEGRERTNCGHSPPRCCCRFREDHCSCRRYPRLLLEEKDPVPDSVLYKFPQISNPRITHTYLSPFATFPSFRSLFLYKCRYSCPVLEADWCSSSCTLGKHHRLKASATPVSTS